MSHPFAPKQILKKGISRQEYSLLEEWAPDTLKDYIVPNSPQTECHTQTTLPTKTEGYGVNSKRVQARSSSLYEEWKAKALRSPGKPKEFPFILPPMNTETGETTSTSSVETRAVVGDNSGVAVGSQFKRTNDDHYHQQRGRKKSISSVSTSSQPQASTAGTTPRTTPIAAVKRGTFKNGRPNGQENLGRQQQASKEMYTAPNGCRFTKGELKKLSGGVKLENNDTVYFFPCFLEDPWKGLKPTPIPAFPPV